MSSKSARPYSSVWSNPEIKTGSYWRMTDAEASYARYSLKPGFSKSVYWS